MKKALFISLMVFALTLAYFKSGASEDELNRQVEKFGGSIGNLLKDVLKKMPAWKENREQARAVLPELKKFPEPVPVPSDQEIFAWIKALAQTPHRRPGSPEEAVAGQYLIQELKRMGITEIHQDPIPVKYWRAQTWKLEIENGSGFKDFPAFYVTYTGFTPEQGMEAEMVYVGAGRPKDFAHKEVKGKIVVGEVPFPNLPYGAIARLLPIYYLSDPDHSIGFGFFERLIFVRQNFMGYGTAERHPENDIYWAAHERGAAGILLILRDQPTNSNTHYGPYDGILKPMPGFWIGKYDGAVLRPLAQAGKRARMILTGEVTDRVTNNIYAILPGKSDRTIVLHSHYDAPFAGVTEDAAGCSQVLAQAWAWSKIPLEKRPKTLVFLFTTGHFYGSIGSHTFARQHKDDLLKKADLILTLEHIGAKEAREGKDRQYEFTGRMEMGGIFTAPQKYVMAAVMKMLEKNKLPRVMSVPINFFGETPPTDASGFVLEPGMKAPVLSWITGPAYLLCAEDTLDKIEVDMLDKYARAIADLVGYCSTIPSEKIVGAGME